MKWVPIARVKVVAGQTTSFTRSFTRIRYEILAITLGPKRQLRCGCTRTWTLLPEEAELPENADTCLHIKLLYGNGRAHHSIQANTPFLAADRSAKSGIIYLSPRGRELFCWRYSELALK